MKMKNVTMKMMKMIKMRQMRQMRQMMKMTKNWLANYAARGLAARFPNGSPGSLPLARAAARALAGSSGTLCRTRLRLDTDKRRHYWLATRALVTLRDGARDSSPGTPAPCVAIAAGLAPAVAAPLWLLACSPGAPMLCIALAAGSAPTCVVATAG
jgi:hypothetical protein